MSRFTHLPSSSTTDQQAARKREQRRTSATDTMSISLAIVLMAGTVFFVAGGNDMNGDQVIEVTNHRPKSQPSEDSAHPELPQIDSESAETEQTSSSTSTDNPKEVRRVSTGIQSDSTAPDQVTENPCDTSRGKQYPQRQPFPPENPAYKPTITVESIGKQPDPSMITLNSKDDRYSDSYVVPDAPVDQSQPSATPSESSAPPGPTNSAQ